MPLKDYSTRDKYTYPNSPVLINIPGIKDGERLEQFEADAAFRRQLQLSYRPLTGKFDLDHLKAIHRYLFQDVYSWAGDLRTVNISKGNSMFGLYQHLDAYLRPVLDKLSGERYLTGLDPDAFTNRAAYYLSEINAAHPFREGNGRTQREFLRELAFKAGYRMNWDRVSREELYEASEASMLYTDLGRFNRILMNITLPL